MTKLDLEEVRVEFSAPLRENGGIILLLSASKKRKVADEGIGAWDRRYGSNFRKVRLVGLNLPTVSERTIQNSWVHLTKIREQRTATARR